ELQRLTGDLTIRVLRVEEGSVRLTLKMTRSAAEKLVQLQRDGTLHDIGGIHVMEVVASTFEEDESNQVGQPKVVKKDLRVLSTEIENDKRRRFGVTEYDRDA